MFDLLVTEEQFGVASVDFGMAIEGLAGSDNAGRCSLQPPASSPSGRQLPASPPADRRPESWRARGIRLLLQTMI